MRPPKWLCLLILLLTTSGVMGAIVSAGGRYPSPWVDDWTDVDLRDGTNTCNAALVACLTGTGGRAIFKAGTYKISPTTATALADSLSISGQGVGVTILSAVAGETGACLAAGSDNAFTDLTFVGNDEATTTGLTVANGKHRLTCTRVEFKDFSTGASASNGAINGAAYVLCKWTSNVTGLSVASASTGLVVDAGVFNDNTTSAISLHGNPDGGIITGCTFVNEPLCINLASSTRITIEGNAFLAGTTSVAMTAPVRCVIGENYWAFDTIDIPDVQDKQVRLHGRYYGTVSPAAGSWSAGERVTNAAPGTSAATAIEWACSTGGTSGTWQPLYRSKQIYTGTATWDPGSLDAGQSATTQLTISGAVSGDLAIATHTQNLPTGFTIHAQSIGSGLVDVTLSNVGGTTQDVASGTVTVMVLRP